MKKNFLMKSSSETNTSFTMKELLDAGIHLGHQVHEWNPRMATYIHGVRNHTHIIDLEQTMVMLRRVTNVVKNIASNRGDILFLGTRNDISNIIAITAKRCSQHYMNVRWVNGTLTNWNEIYRSIEKLKYLEKNISNSKYFSPSDLRKYKRLKNSFQGIKNMDSLPDLLFVVDTNQHRIALKEAAKLNIPTIGIVDSNCDPLGITYPIPGNDDSIESIYFYCNLISNSIIEGRKEEYMNFKNNFIN